MDERDLRDVAALADGSLPPARRAEVEARVAGSAELRAELERQRGALAAVRTAAAARAPESLRAALAARSGTAARAPRFRGWRRPLLAGAAAAAVAAVVVVVLALSGGSGGGPGVSEAAALG